MQDKRLFYLIHQAHRKLFKDADKVCLDRLGITSVQLSALFFLMQRNGCLLKELAEGLELNNSAVTGLVNRMEKLRLLVKKTSMGDARSTEVHMTDKAKLLVPDGYKIVNQFNKDIAEEFTNSEMDVIYRFLNKLASGA